MHKHLIDVSAGGQLVPECIVRPGGSVSLLTWYIKLDIYVLEIKTLDNRMGQSRMHNTEKCRNLHFLNNVIQKH